MSKFLDIESVRSKYSDITVTAVPKGQLTPKSQSLDNNEEIKPHVEITRVPVGNTPSTSKGAIKPTAQESQSSANNYAIEYAAILAKLEKTKFMQTQIAMLIQPLPLSFVPSTNETLTNLMGFNLPAFGNGFSTLDANANIMQKYDSLLTVIAGMRPNIPPSYQGVRSPKERLIRDIGQARVLVRECKLLLERDALQEF